MRTGARVFQIYVFARDVAVCMLFLTVAWSIFLLRGIVD